MSHYKMKVTALPEKCKSREYDANKKKWTNLKLFDKNDKQLKEGYYKTKDGLIGKVNKHSNTWYIRFGEQYKKREEHIIWEYPECGICSKDLEPTVFTKEK